MMQAGTAEIRNTKLPHAILVCGGTADERSRKVIELTRRLLTVKQGKHPDLIELHPEGKARIVSVDQVRQIESVLMMRSYADGGKIAVIHEGDKMSPSAANALLKTLEEPPPRTHIIISAPNRDSVLPTISSRCECITIKGTGRKSRSDVQNSAIACIKVGIMEPGCHIEKGVMLAAKILKIAEDSADSVAENETKSIKEAKKIAKGEGVETDIAKRESDLEVMLSSGRKTQALLVIGTILEMVTAAAAAGTEDVNGYFATTVGVLKEAENGISRGANRKLIFEHALLAVMDVPMDKMQEIARRFQLSRLASSMEVTL